MGPLGSSTALSSSHGQGGLCQSFTFYLRAELCSFVQYALKLYQSFILL